MECQKTQSGQYNPEKEQQSWKTDTPQLQDLLETYNQGSERTDT